MWLISTLEENTVKVVMHEQTEELYEKGPGGLWSVHGRQDKCGLAALGPLGPGDTLGTRKSDTLSCGSEESQHQQP